MRVQTQVNMLKILLENCYWSPWLFSEFYFQQFSTMPTLFFLNKNTFTTNQEIKNEQRTDWGSTSDANVTASFYWKTQYITS